MDRYIEQKRLMALTRSGLLTVESNDALRRLVEFARRDFQVPIVRVSLMNEACLVPLKGAGLGGNPIPREEAFCSATVAMDQTTVILDASIDPHWSDSPLVEGAAHLRFYAGVPLRFEGQPVGTFCIIGPEPRSRFDQADRERLEAYAEATSEALELWVLKRERNLGDSRFEQMAAATPDAMIICDNDGGILFVNQRAEHLFGYSSGEFLELQVRDLLPERTRYLPGEFVVMFDGVVGRTQEIEAIVKGGRARTLEFSLARWTENDGIRYGAIVRDVTARKASEAKLVEMAHRDGLTGLPNRTVMQIRLQEALDGGSVAVLLVDLDGFKDVNEKFGHAVGDEVLRLTAKRLTGCVQPTDTVARMSGDEFVVILPRCGDGMVTTEVADRIVRSLGEPFVTQDGDVRLSASIGLAFGPTHGATTEEVLKSADTALYRAKADGRNRQVLYAPGLRSANAERVRFGQEFHRAMADGEFVLHYQPQVSLGCGALVGAEALLRWQHPELGLLQPGAFLSSLLASRHDAAIGEWVLRTACKQAADWRALGRERFRMGVNASACHIRSGQIAPLVKEILQDYALPASNLEVEITETVMLGDDERALVALRALRDIGVGIAFDDYGTGYASLSMLKRFPLTRLKIDRSFVQEMVDVPDVTLIRAILQLAEGFGLTVIAEGIETEDQRRRLLRKGCSEGQGYFFGRPMAASEFQARFVEPEADRSCLSA